MKYTFTLEILITFCLIIVLERLIHNFSLIKVMRKEWNNYSKIYNSRKSALKKKKRRVIVIFISILILIVFRIVFVMILKSDIKMNFELMNLLCIICGILIFGGAFVIIKHLDDKDNVLEDHVSIMNNGNSFCLVSKYGINAHISQKATLQFKHTLNYYMIAKIPLDGGIINNYNIKEIIKKYEALGDCKANAFKEDGHLIIECFMYSNKYIRKNSKMAWYIEEKTVELFKEVMDQLES